MLCTEMFCAHSKSRYVDMAADLTLLTTAPAAAIAPIMEQLIVTPSKHALAHFNGMVTAAGPVPSADNLHIERLSGAMTNIVYKCYAPHLAKNFLVRVHASEDELFDRATELATFEAVSRAELGPRLLLLFRNGRVEQYLDDHTVLTARAIRLPQCSDLIAQELARFHATLAGGTAGGSEGGAMWSRLSNWTAQAVALWSDSDSHLQLLEDLNSQLPVLRDVLWRRFPCPAGLCHCDLQYGNIMLHSALAPSAGLAPSLDSATTACTCEGGQQGGCALCAQRPSLGTGDAESKSAASWVAQQGSLGLGVGPKPASGLGLGPLLRPLVLIDYEYSCCAPLAFDLANHWCEWSADYHTDTPHVLDFSRMPGEAERLAFAHSYLGELLRQLGVKVDMSEGDASGAGDGPVEGLSPVDGSMVQNGGGARSAEEGDLMWLQPLLHGQRSDGVRCGVAGGGGAETAVRVSDRVFSSMVEVLARAGSAYEALSHVHWALWGFVQARASSVEFEFEEYAKQRLQGFRATLAKLLA